MAETLLLLFTEWVTGDEACGGLDGTERCAEFVGGHGDETTLQFIQLFFFFQGVLEFPFIVPEDGFDLLSFLDLPIEGGIDLDKLVVFFFQLEVLWITFRSSS